MLSHQKYLYFILSFGIFVCSLSPIFAAQLPEEIAQQLNRFGIPVNTVSLDIREAETNSTILSVNSSKPRNPASVIKLLTTLSALEILGPNYQWQTQYLISGKLNDDVIQGDLIFQGSGDPFLTVDQLWHHVLSIRERGIRTIEGSLIIDNTLFDLPKHNRSEFDGQSTRLYNVGPDAALVNFSSTRFVIHPIGNRITIFSDPPIHNLIIRNKITGEKGKCKSKHSGWTYGFEQFGETLTATFKGSYRNRCGQHSISRSLFSNPEYTYRLFKHLWLESGGVFSGGYRIDETPENATTLINYPSEPLANIITSINKWSNNVMSRNLLLTLDAQNEDISATPAGARKVVSDWLAINGLKMPGLNLENGSGLSRKTRISSRSLGDLLHHGWNSNYRPEFMSSFPLSALDGTMQKRLHDSELQSRARIKTGLINGVRSMAGYINSRQNKHYIVAMMIESNKVNYSNGNAIQDTVLKWIYNH